MPQKSDLRRRDAGYRVPRLQRVPLKTVVGIFTLHQSSKGLYRILFPQKQPILKPGFRMGWRISRWFRRMKLDRSGLTPFQRKVYAALRKVPAGTTVTYGELARRAGFPGAARAVGSAMRKNRLPIVIPCHRVVPVSGGLGEYSGGKKWKRWLLEHEALFVQRATANAQRKRSKPLLFAR